MNSTQIAEEVRKPNNSVPLTPSDAIEIKLSIPAFKKMLSTVLNTYRTGRSLRNDIRALTRDSEVKARIDSIGVSEKPFICSDTVCLQRYKTKRKNVLRSEYARVVILDGDFKVQQWSETDFFPIRQQVTNSQTTTAMRTIVMAKLAKQGVTADEVRGYILGNQSKENSKD